VLANYQLSPAQLERLRTILSYRRPHGTVTERRFTYDNVATLPGAWEDYHGNIHVEVGVNNRVLFSCHTDTVHYTGGRQTVILDRGYLRRRMRANDCLGADDGVGVFLMLEMIDAGVPGYYIFHTAEEVGALGSKALARSSEDVLRTFDYAIAFDRRGTKDVITHQYRGRTASDAFATSLAAMLNRAGLEYAPSNRGIFTDTASYSDIIAECTNVSVGYYNEHTSNECVDVAHVGALLGALLAFDVNALVCDRIPGEDDTPIKPTKVTRLDRAPESDLDYTHERIVDIRSDGERTDKDSVAELGVNPRIIDGMCSLCEWPSYACHCTAEDVEFWRYMNGYTYKRTGE